MASTVTFASSPLELHHASTEHAVFVVVPARRFLAIGGVGSPGAADFAFAGAALRTTAEILGRNLRYEALHLPARAEPVECLWTPHEALASGDLAAGFGDRARWSWRQLIEVPDAATSTHIEAAVEEGRRAAGRDVALIRSLAFTEGWSAQLLHAGAEDAEAASVAKLVAAITDAELEPRQWLHTVPISRPGAARRRMIIRQPVSQVRQP